MVISILLEHFIGHAVACTLLEVLDMSLYIYFNKRNSVWLTGDFNVSHVIWSNSGLFENVNHVHVLPITVLLILYKIMHCISWLRTSPNLGANNFDFFSK